MGWLLLTSLGAFLLAGCTMVGVLATTDPNKKRQDCLYVLEDIKRPLMCEILVRKILAIYEQRGDQPRIGNAYRVCGIFLTSGIATQWERYYRQNGFQDKRIMFDGRFATAVEYVLRVVPLLRDARHFDLVTGVYYHQAFALGNLGQQTRACASLEPARAAYEENGRRCPTATPNPGRSASVPAAIANAKRRVRCA